MGEGFNVLAVLLGLTGGGEDHESRTPWREYGSGPSGGLGPWDWAPYGVMVPVSGQIEPCQLLQASRVGSPVTADRVGPCCSQSSPPCASPSGATSGTTCLWPKT